MPPLANWKNCIYPPSRHNISPSPPSSQRTHPPCLLPPCFTAASMELGSSLHGAPHPFPLHGALPFLSCPRRGHPFSHGRAAALHAPPMASRPSSSSMGAGLHLPTWTLAELLPMASLPSSASCCSTASGSERPHQPCHGAARRGSPLGCHRGLAGLLLVGELMLLKAPFPACSLSPTTSSKDSISSTA